MNQTANKSIKIAVYNASERYDGYATGVSRHVKHTVSGLNQDQDFSVRFLVPKDYWEIDKNCTQSSALFSVESIRVPISRRVHKALAVATTWPTLEKYAGDVDWIYSPREILLHTKNAKTAITIHDIYNFEHEHQENLSTGARINKAIWHKAVRQANVVLTVSNFTKSRICDLFSIEEEKIVVIGNGVESLFYDIFESDPHEITPLPGRGYYITVGEICAKKGATALLEFARILEHQNPSFLLVVIGKVHPYFQTEVDSLKNVHIIQRGINDTEMAKWLRGAIALVALSEYEGFGIPVVEAMAAGVPVIASNRAALPETVGEAGIIVEPTSNKQLEDAAMVWKDNLFRDRLIQLGRERAKRFSWHSCVDRLARVFK